MGSKQEILFKKMLRKRLEEAGMAEVNIDSAIKHIVPEMKKTGTPFLLKNVPQVAKEIIQAEPMANKKTMEKLNQEEKSIFKRWIGK